MGQQQSFFSDAQRLVLLKRKATDVLILSKPLVYLSPTDTVDGTLTVSLVSHDFSTKNNTLTITADISILDLIGEMRLAKAHCVVLVNEKDEIKQLISQSNILEFVLLNLDVLHENPDETLLKLQFFGTTPIGFVSGTEPVLDAFIYMHNEDVSSVPAYGNLSISKKPFVGPVSVRDLKSVTRENFKELIMPAVDFVKKKNESSDTFLSDLSTLTLRELIRCMVIDSNHNVYFAKPNISPSSSSINKQFGGGGGGATSPLSPGGSGVREAEIPYSVITHVDVIDYVLGDCINEFRKTLDV
ncbi:hypothetical protein HK096_000330 [Nowakowskiella sp. JEL0078]|nr:hypothetical protein HK096_000330 [Nowakowskiella sp. JEL0078]